jgi:hypothetical protein
MKTSIATTNRTLLRLLAGEVVVGLGVVLVAVLLRLFGEPSGTQRLVATVPVIFQVSYVTNAVGALVSLSLFVNAGEDELGFPRVVGHVLNWVYVVGLSWVFGAMVLMNSFGAGRD